MKIGHLRVSPSLFQSEPRCKAIIWKIFLISRKKTHFHYKGFSLGHDLKASFWNSDMAYLDCPRAFFFWFHQWIWMLVHLRLLLTSPPSAIYQGLSPRTVMPVEKCCLSQQVLAINHNHTGGFYSLLNPYQKPLFQVFPSGRYFHWKPFGHLDFFFH